MYACVCNRISDRQLAERWAEAYPDLAALVQRLGLDSERCCGRCVEELDSLVAAAGRPPVRAGSAREPAGAAR